jgi:hypothetical protein
MTIGANYSTPVAVNGFLCKNCTDVDYAKKHIDPAHPKSGPYGINAKNDTTAQKPATSAAVTFGGNLSNFNVKQALMGGGSVADPSNAMAAAEPSNVAIGTQLDVSA